MSQQTVVFIDCVPFTVDKLIKLMKHRFRTAEAFVAASEIVFRSRPTLKDMVIELWQEIEPLSIEELFNPATPYSDASARVHFQTVGPRAIFTELRKKRMINRAEFTSTHPTEGPFQNVYELYTIEDERLPSNRAAVLLCYCPSTGADHYLYVNPTGTHIDNADALEALASICYCPYDPSGVVEINRQGEVYYFTVKNGTKRLQTSVPMTKSDYLKKIKYES